MSKRKREAAGSAVSISAASKPENQTDQTRVARLRKSSFQSKIIGLAIVLLIAGGALGATLKYLEEDARRQTANGSLKTGGSDETSLLNRVNPFRTSGTERAINPHRKGFVG